MAAYVGVYRKTGGYCRSVHSFHVLHRSEEADFSILLAVVCLQALEALGGGRAKGKGIVSTIPTYNTRRLRAPQWDAKELPTAHHSAQRHSPKYLARHDPIKKMVALRNPASMFMVTWREHEGYFPPS